MSDSDLSIPDKLAALTADLDQAQALIDEARSKFPDDVEFNKQLDHQQFLVEIRREQVGLLKFIDKQIDS